MFYALHRVQSDKIYPPTFAAESDDSIIIYKPLNFYFYDK